MTLRLVENVSELPIVSVADTAARLRLLANNIESGQTEDVRTCIHVLVRDGGLAIHISGEACSAYELMGLLEAAKLRVFADDVIDD